MEGEVGPIKHVCPGVRQNQAILRSSHRHMSSIGSPSTDTTQVCLASSDLLHMHLALAGTRTCYYCNHYQTLQAGDVVFAPEEVGIVGCLGLSHLGIAKHLAVQLLSLGLQYTGQ